jgi:IclR family acetate operon transcriptional repressor
VPLAPTPGPVIRAARKCNETVFTTRILDGKIVCTSLVESIHHLRLFVHLGQEMPLHAAASARVILAHRDPVFVERLLTESPRDAFTGVTVREVNRIITHLSDVRRQGYDVCNSELDPDVWAVAAPVFEEDGRVESGITLAAAARRMANPGRRADATLVIMKAARELSDEQGYLGDWPRLPARDDLAVRFAREPISYGHPVLPDDRAS